MLITITPRHVNPTWNARRRFSAETLGNGYIRVYDYRCKEAALYTMDGQRHSGAPMPLRAHQVLELAGA